MVALAPRFFALSYVCALVALSNVPFRVKAGIIPGYRQSEIITATNARSASEEQDPFRLNKGLKPEEVLKAKGSSGLYVQPATGVKKSLQSEIRNPSLDLTLGLFGRRLKRSLARPNVNSYYHSQQYMTREQSRSQPKLSSSPSGRPAKAEISKSKEDDSAPQQQIHPDTGNQTPNLTPGLFGRRVRRSPAQLNLSAHYHAMHNVAPTTTAFVAPRSLGSEDPSIRYPLKSPSFRLASQEQRPRIHARDFILQPIKPFSKSHGTLVVEPFPTLVMPPRHRYRGRQYPTHHSHKNAGSAFMMRSHHARAFRRREQPGVKGRVDIMSPVDGSDKGTRLASLCLTEQFTLDACEKNQTDIYLVAVNSASTSPDPASSSNDQVTLQIPVYDPDALSMASFCATYDSNPNESSPLTVERCHMSPAVDDSSHKSQRFDYNKETSIVRPMQYKQPEPKTSSASTMSTIKLSMRHESTQNLTLVFVADAPVVAKYGSTSRMFSPSPTKSVAASSPPVQAASHLATSADNTFLVTSSASNPTATPMHAMDGSPKSISFSRSESPAGPTSRQELEESRPSPTKWGAEEGTPLIVNLSPSKPTQSSSTMYKAPLDAELVASRIADRVAARSIPTLGVVDTAPYQWVFDKGTSL